MASSASRRGAGTGGSDGGLSGRVTTAATFERHCLHQGTWDGRSPPLLCRCRSYSIVDVGRAIDRCQPLRRSYRDGTGRLPQSQSSCFVRQWRKHPGYVRRALVCNDIYRLGIFLTKLPFFYVQIHDLLTQISLLSMLHANISFQSSLTRINDIAYSEKPLILPLEIVWIGLHG